MCKKHFGDHRFVCHTDDPTGILPAIEIRILDEDLELENWWWKLQLFDEDRFNETIHHKHLFFDLDVVIQNDLTPIVESIELNKLTLVNAFWKHYPLKKLDMKNNSSVMAWEGDVTRLWRKFNKDPDKYILKYDGIDGYLTHECYDYLKTFDRGLIYSRLFGVDEKNCFKPTDGNQPNGYFFEPDYAVCIFNGWRREKDPTGKYWLDNDAYDDLEHYWQPSNWIEKNYSGIDRNLWKAIWECSQNNGDTTHFLDSLSPNQVESKLWLVDCLEKHTPFFTRPPRKVQLFGGWFAHPISSILHEVFPSIQWIENIDIDDTALHTCRTIHEKFPIEISTTHRNVMHPDERDWDIDLVINTSSEHMPPLPVIIEGRKFRRLEDDLSKLPCMFAIQSNNMFHVKDHINCVNSEDELVDMCKFSKVLYKGSLDMPNGYKRFMAIGYA